MKKTLFILIGFVLLFSLLLGACKKTTPATTTTTGPTTTAPSNTTASATAAPTADKYGGIWKEALTTGPSRPIGYPAEAAPDSYTDAAPALEQLVNIQTDGTITPMLATAWKVADDGKSITLTLRKGVKFSDGSDFNADVCKWNLDTVLAAKNSGTVGWQSIDKIDDYTVRINITGYSNVILSNLASGVSQQISEAYVEKNGIAAAEWNPIGTGPFIMTNFTRDASITYKRNPNYWDTGKPYLDGVTFTVIPDWTVQKLALQKGDVTLLRNVAGLDAVNLQQAGYPMKAVPFGTFVLVPDSTVAGQPWANVNVRLAASYALDRDSLAKALGFGFLKPAYQIYPGFADTHIANLVPTTYNPAKAKDLLTQAGYPNGFTTVIHAFTRVIPNDYTTAVAAQLNAVGITVTTDFPTSGAYDNFRFNGWSDGLLNHALSKYPNDNASFTSYFGGKMFASLKLPEGFQQAVNASLATPQIDPAKIQAVIQLMCNDMTVIPYMEQTQISFYQKGANDPDADAYGLMSSMYADCWLDKSAR